ncbi:hypothetical protein KIPB_016157, partial [Kipferlia bialata]|eukprot:g16157.t1
MDLASNPFRPPPEGQIFKVREAEILARQQAAKDGKKMTMLDKQNAYIAKQIKA